MPPPSHFLLHDVAANTYSRDLILNTGVRNLHRLFAVSPRWYNRSKHKRDGVTVVRYKHATPRHDIHMVDLRRASRRVQRIVADDHLVGGVKLAAAAKVAGAVVLGLGAAHYLLGDRSKKNSAIQQEQQELNSECLRQLKTAIGQKNTNHPNVRVSCVPVYDGKELEKGERIGKGKHGEVFSVKGNDRVVIKEQRALCYSFYNEIDCLYALRETGIAPQLYDAYICSNPPVTDATENSQIKYGYVMQKVDMSLLKFINNTPDEDLDLDDIADKINTIFEVLKKADIYHRDLHLDNFMVATTTSAPPRVDRIYVIDFGAAVSPNKDRDTITEYQNPLKEQEYPSENWQNFYNTLILAYAACRRQKHIFTDEAICKKPVIYLGLAKRVLFRNRTSAEKIWQEDIVRHLPPEDIKQIQ